MGVLFALLPDLDFLILTALGKNTNRHRELLHRPLVLLPIWVGIWAFFGPELAWLFATAVTAHLLHDSIGIGWGVQWLFPFSKSSYSFLHHIENNTGTKPKIRRRLLYRWDVDELDRIANAYGDPDWFRTIYLRLHPYAIVEFMGFLVGVSVYIILLAQG